MTSLVSVKQLNEPMVEWLLRQAQYYIEHEPKIKINGHAVNLFFEPSTRTSLSFQLAAQRMGLTLLDFEVEQSSVKKGESLIDSLQTLDAMGVKLAIVRHGDDWPKLIAEAGLKMSVINAGSGIHEHPTQALLDALTIKQHFGSFAGLKVAVVGDVRHSRVARSNVYLLQMLGAKVSFSGPEIFKPLDLSEIPWIDFDQAVAESDVVMMLRVQHERHETAYAVADYNKRYGLNAERLKQLAKHALILHPGPVNRGVEITDEVMGDPRCKILQQVTNGVAVRMAVLHWCLREESNGQLVPA